jgi:hypothetical protein
VRVALMGEPSNFDDLSPRARSFLGNLTDERIDELEASIEFSRKIKTVSSFFKWLIIGVTAFVVATAALGDAVQKIWSWVAPALRLKS